MKAAGKLILYGILLWMTVFISSIFIFPLKETNPLFFETLIAIFLCLFTVLVSVWYFKDKAPTVKSAVITGITWMAVSIIIDLPLFSAGPMKKPLADYFTDIGLTYLMIPVITTGIAFALKNALKNFIKGKDGK